MVSMARLWQNLRDFYRPGRSVGHSELIFPQGDFECA
jgi:hypothetical protein